MKFIKPIKAFANDIIEGPPKNKHQTFKLVILIIIMFILGTVVGIQGERYFHPKDEPIIFEVTPEQEAPYEHWVIPPLNKENRKVQI